MARGAGRGLPKARLGGRGAVWAGIFFDQQAVFSLGAPGPLRRRAQSDCGGAAPRGLPRGQGVCVGARRENGRKMQCWAPWLCRLFLAFEMGAALVEIPLGFSTCGEIWLFWVYMSPPGPAGALPLFFGGSRGCPFLAPSLSRRRRSSSTTAKAAPLSSIRQRSCADTHRGIETLSIDHVPR